MDREILDRTIVYLRNKLIEWWDTTEKDDAATEDIIKERITIDGYTLFIICVDRGSAFLDAKKVNGNQIEQITIFHIGHPDTPSELIDYLKQKLDMYSNKHSMIMNPEIMSIVW